MYDFSVIRSLRKKRGLSGDELAAKAGLTRATVAKIEAGEGNPTVSTLTALAQGLGLRGSELLLLAEAGHLESPQVSQVRRAHCQGRRYQIGGLEFFVLRAQAGRSLGFDPGWRANTAEVLLVISGRLRLLVSGQAKELGPGECVGFKALREHKFQVLADTEFVIIHATQ